MHALTQLAYYSYAGDPIEYQQSQNLTICHHTLHYNFFSRRLRFHCCYWREIGFQQSIVLSSFFYVSLRVGPPRFSAAAIEIFIHALISTTDVCVVLFYVLVLLPLQLHTSTLVSIQSKTVDHLRRCASSLNSI